MLDLVLAALPLLTILALMIGLRWGAARAGVAGWILTLGVAALRFGAGPDVLLVAHGKALLLSLDVLLVIWAAFALYRVSDEAGAIAVLSRAITSVTRDRDQHALLVGWAFASFLQGVGGYGVPVAVAAPLLVGLGFGGLQAAVIASVGHAWAVTFGSVAASFQALMAASGLDGRLLGLPAALLLGLAGFACGLCVLHASGGLAALRARWQTVVLIGSAMGGVQAALVAAGMWNLAAFSAGFAGLAAGLWLARRGQSTSYAAPPPAREVLLALAGYGLLVGLILVVQLVAPLREFLSQWALRVGFLTVATSRGFATPDEAGRVIRWLTHPGTLIALAAALVAVLYRRTGWLAPGSGRKVAAATARRTAGTTLSVVSMVSLAVVMQHAGMTAALASSLAAGLGAIYPAVAPWIGALGAFITGSNTNANVLFTALQRDTAVLLGLPVAAILAAQTAGGAVASVLAPTKIVVGAATVGLEGKEGLVMRSMAPYILGILFLMSAAAALMALL